MQYKGSRQEPGVSVHKTSKREYSAFSLAEMLVVLLIMSFIAIGVPLIHFKKTELKTKRSLHGRYECYYDAAGQLNQYTVNEEGAQTLTEGVTECTFTPSRNAVFFLIHAVGGGGGASTATGSVSVSPSSETNTYHSSQINSFPQWAKDAQGADLIPKGATTYTLSRSGSVARVHYGLSGNAGKTMSMFFPRLNNVTVVMKPGKGGDAGQPGATTEVYFKTATNSTKIMEATGGTGGSGSGDIQFWLDGETAMCAVKDLAGRKFKEADFASNIEMDKGSKMPSKMEEALAGSGGAGAYGNVTTTHTVSYIVNGTDVGAGVKRPDCENPKLCDNDPEGSTPKTSCPAEKGRNGAVVILW